MKPITNGGVAERLGHLVVAQAIVGSNPTAPLQVDNKSLSQNRRPLLSRAKSVWTKGAVCKST